MRPEVAQRQIQAFRERFGEAHFALAIHAAFPLALTPDLLYHLWANFQQDIHGGVLNIPWLAVSDLLLSSLCDEVGHELYEMHKEVRNNLLAELKANPHFGSQRIHELSDFLLTHVKQQLESHDADIRDFAQAQRWTALAYVEPNQLAQEIASTFSKLNLDERTEWIHIASIVETFAEPLEEFQPLLSYARGMEDFVCGNLELAVTAFESITESTGQFHFAGVNLSIPEQILSRNKEAIRQSISVTAAIPVGAKEPEAIGVTNVSPARGQVIARTGGSGKLVVLKITNGSFDQGFWVTLQIGEESTRPSVKVVGKLPPAPELPLYYDRWQTVYYSLGVRTRLTSTEINRTNLSPYADCLKAAQILQARLNTWLHTEEFRPIREKWLERCPPSDIIRAVIQTDDHQVWRLPWHLWDGIERYPRAEIALGPLAGNSSSQTDRQRHQISILAILGNSEGINIYADRAMLKQLPDTSITYLVEPTRRELTDNLWEHPCDILFFAGHSSSRLNEAGRIFLNPTDSINVSELKYALRKAVERGLKIAIFNSCDGLGLARELVDLQIPQIVVMREPVPEPVAQEFLKYFLAAYSRGETFYLAVRQARERLQGLEDLFPCASWLPVIIQNPAEAPPTWQELTGKARGIASDPSNTQTGK